MPSGPSCSSSSFSSLPSLPYRLSISLFLSVSLPVSNVFRSRPPPSPLLPSRKALSLFFSPHSLPLSLSIFISSRLFHRSAPRFSSGRYRRANRHRHCSARVASVLIRFDPSCRLTLKQTLFMARGIIAKQTPMWWPAILRADVVHRVPPAFAFSVCFLFVWEGWKRNKRERQRERERERRSRKEKKRCVPMQETIMRANDTSSTVFDVYDAHDIDVATRYADRLHRKEGFCRDPRHNGNECALQKMWQASFLLYDFFPKSALDPSSCDVANRFVRRIFTVHISTSTCTNFLFS